MSTIVLLTGPAGAGKNTTAKELANLRDRLAIIDTDDVRHMIVKPHKAPWEGEEGKEQYRFGALNTCWLAKQFAGQNFDVVILNCVGTKLAELYRTELHDQRLIIVQLLPSLEIAKQRNAARSQGQIDSERVEQTYRLSLQPFGPDLTIDNSTLPVRTIAEQISNFMDGRDAD